MKKVLIAGKNSYIGTSLENWLMREPTTYSVTTVDMKGADWRAHSFAGYDTVVHVAGIAHVAANERNKDLYYAVNRDLAIETAKKAKEEGAKQFVFLSSMSVYGDCRAHNGIIDASTVPAPADHYGISKLQAEQALREVESMEFPIAIVRPPMVYGKGAPGNYPRLSRLARLTPIFPDIKNQRSMIHIDNLCEFIKLLIGNGDGGLFFPQNAEYVNTSELVRAIAAVHGKRVLLTDVFNPLIRLALGYCVVLRRVFNDLVYDKALSEYDRGSYQVWDMQGSLVITEKR
jgi:UDP-glucose 4-epimerase